jgi:hypothetical protein
VSQRVKCPQCGAENLASDINCTSCGTSLVAEPPKPPEPIPTPPAEADTSLPPSAPTPEVAPPPGEAAPSEAPAKMDDETAEKVRDQVLTRMREGADNQTIIDELVEGGMDKDQAPQIVAAIDAAVAEAAAQEEYGLGSLVGAVVGGLIAATIGGVVWGFIVVKTEREIGYVAWGIGLLCGFAVVLFAGRKKGLPFQFIAVLASILGILIGKYATFFMLLRQQLAEIEGEIIVPPSVFDPRAIVVFFQMLPELLSGFDILWVLLAVLSAWRIPRGLGVKRPSHVAPPPRIG